VIHTGTEILYQGKVQAYKPSVMDAVALHPEELNRLNESDEPITVSVREVKK